MENPYRLEGKYKNEEDKKLLEQMDEIQREQILFDRMQEIERVNEQKYLEDRIKKQENSVEIEFNEEVEFNKDDKIPKKTIRSSTRSVKKVHKLNKLNELKRQREQKSLIKKKDHNNDSNYEDDNDKDSNDDYEFEELPSFSFNTNSQEFATLDDINKICLGRNELSQYFFYSEFKSIVLGCYSKINLGFDVRTGTVIYRVVKIIGVQTNPQFSYKLDNFNCDIFLLVSQNKNQTKEFPITFFSNKKIYSEEFERYLKELDKTGEKIDYLDDVEKKHEQLSVLFNRGVSNKDVNEIIIRKQKNSNDTDSKNEGFVFYNAIFEKSKYLEELKIAEQQDDMNKIKEIQQKLNQMDNIINKHKLQSSKFDLNTTKINERNRKLNQTIIRKAEINTKNTTFSNDNENPFSKLRTSTRLFYDDTLKHESEKIMNNPNTNYSNSSFENIDLIDKNFICTYKDLGEMDKFIKSVKTNVNLLI